MTDEPKDKDDLEDMEPDEELEDMKVKEGDTDDIVGGARQRAQEKEGT
jgi:hypothetical protein